MTTTTKRKKRPTPEQEAEAARAKLRRYVGRLTTYKSKDGEFTYDYKPRMTLRMFVVLMRIDEAMIGTPDYMGIAYWWSPEYKHDLRDATTKQRKKAHDALVKAGLRLDGESDEHARIIAWATSGGPKPRT